ncbi:hypothetical protein SAMN02910369_01020 [Lachnospiraceae bacterium NE2001]|nr:hypothetical protein SAMN02910369_01020 [Lachnospiraceae bacterium NE2001]
MMNQGIMTGIKCCIKKDIKEVLRTGKLILFASLALGIGVMIMGFTLLFTDIPDALALELPGFDIQSLEDMMITLYPRRVGGSCGVFSYYIGFFYSLITILVCNNIIPKEQKNGKWILPREMGYRGRDFLTSKCIVYGGLAGLSVFVSYMLYYFTACTMFERDMTFGNALFLAILHGLNIFFILDYTFLFAAWFKSGVVAAISMIGTVLFVPDIMNFLPIGKYMPTFLLTFVYDYRSDYGETVAPLIFNLLIFAATYVFAVNRLDREEIM